MPMAEDGPAKTGPRSKRRGASYAHEWNRFVAWSETAGKRALPATSEDVAAYLENRAEAGARVSTIKVVAAAIAHNHKYAGFDVPLGHGVARAVLGELTQDDSPGPTRALPLDLDCYLAIRKTAYEPRSGRGGGMERVSNARRRGALDVAMIGLMRDARLRVSEAAELTWGDLERVPGGSGRVRVGETGFRVVSADTMKLVSLVRRGAGDDEPLLGMRPNQIAIRIGAAARQAGLGEGYSGDSPRLGMIQDMETLGVLLLGSHVAENEKWKSYPGSLHAGGSRGAPPSSPVARMRRVEDELARPAWVSLRYPLLISSPTHSFASI